jgi:biopolymer transport protein ExbD
MSVATSPTLKPSGFEHHLTGRGKKRGGKKGMVTGLMLTPMVDMFSLLVIFLLQCFSTSPEMLVINKDVTLPSASTGKEIKDAPVLAITSEGVFMDQESVGTVAEVLANPTRLMQRLSDLRRRWVKSNPSGEFPGEITLQAHKDVSSTTISQIMAMLPSQHYGSIQLAVVAGSSYPRKKI